VSKRREVFHGLKPVLLGLLLMALVYAVAAATGTFGADNKIRFIALGGLILAWLPVVMGTLIMRKERPAFEYAFFTSVVSLVALFAETGLGMKNYLNNMGNQTFIQFDVMFFGYIALVGMMIVYRMMMKGISELSTEKADKKTTTEWKTVWLVSLIVIFAGTLFIPVATLFSGAMEKAMTGVIVLIVIGTELYLCGYINKGYHALQKKR
jgi:hypothetical protein